MNDVAPPKRPRQQASVKPLSPPEAETPAGSAINLPNPRPSTGASSSSPHPQLLLTATHKKRRHWWLIVLCAVLLLLIGLFVGGMLWYQDSLKPLSGSTQQVEVTVKPGSSWDNVVSLLKQHKLIKNETAVMIYLRLHSPGNLKSGTYMIAPNQSVPEIITWLEEGRVGTKRLTILPGKTLAALKQNFIKDGYTAQDVDAAFAATYDHPLLAEKPAGATLEGYIYPETYFIHADEPLQQVLTRSFDEFEKQLQASNTRQQLGAKGFTLHQGIILASMVETEVSNKEDRRQVAQVFLTRLARNMVLGSDVTYKYAAGLLGVPASPTLDSPYNTRIYPGLPPGPVANVTEDVIQAIVDPAPGDYLYFVSGDDGVTHFSHTFEQHEENIRQHCTKLCFGE